MILPSYYYLMHNLCNIRQCSFKLFYFLFKIVYFRPTRIQCLPTKNHRTHKLISTVVHIILVQVNQFQINCSALQLDCLGRNLFCVSILFIFIMSHFLTNCKLLPSLSKMMTPQILYLDWSKKNHEYGLQFYFMKFYMLHQQLNYLEGLDWHKV